jgi:hypothetical protein
VLLAKNPQDSQRTRHIQVRFHWIRQHTSSKELKVMPVRTQQQIADVFTKGLSGPHLRAASRSLGLHMGLKQGEN